MFSDVSKTTAYRIMEKDDRLRSCDVHTLARNMNTLQVKYSQICVNLLLLWD